VVGFTHAVCEWIDDIMKTVKSVIHHPSLIINHPSSIIETARSVCAVGPSLWD
jgi:hypothetical protein